MQKRKYTYRSIDKISNALLGTHNAVSKLIDIHNERKVISDEVTKKLCKSKKVNTEMVEQAKTFLNARL